LESFRDVLKRFADAQVVIIGGESQHIAHYRNVAKHLGIGSNAHFLGKRPVSLLGFYLQQADILVSPRTTGENTPMKIYSYLDSGTPVVATRLPMHDQVLTDDLSVLVDPDPASMSAGIIDLIVQPEKRVKLAQSARRRVRTTYGSDVFRSKLLNFYDHLAHRITIENQTNSG
jgi:glycosyltransferase involved in cell wall biosynthesis